MTEKERQQLIEYIIEHDSSYSYHDVNFKYYSDEDLLTMKKRLDKEISDE